MAAAENVGGTTPHTFPMTDSLIVHTAQQFLGDAEAFVWARCSTGLLRSMRSYRIRRVVPLLQLLCRSEGRGLLPALETQLADISNPDCWAWEPAFRARLVTVLTAALDAVAGGRATSDSAAEPPAPAATAALVTAEVVADNPTASALYCAEIGRVASVDVNSGCFGDVLVSRLRHLGSSVTTVHLSHYDGSERVRLPSSVATLLIGESVEAAALEDMELPEPDGLRQLLFHTNDDFDAPLERLRLPCTLHTLRLGRAFNQPIEKLALPASLTDLTLHFSHSIERLKLPPSLEYLHLGRSFNQPLAQWQPPLSLTTLIMSDEWQLAPDQLRLPPALQHLTLPSAFNHPISDALLPLPSTLRSLRSVGRFNRPLGAIARWPASLTMLHLAGAFKQPLDDWTPPPQLRMLVLGSYTWPLTRLRLPLALTSLTLASVRFDEPLSHEFEWPSQLRHLSLQFASCASPACVPPCSVPPSLQELQLHGMAFLSQAVTQHWLALPLPPHCRLVEDSGLAEPPIDWN